MLQDTAFVGSELMRLAFMGVIGWFLFLSIRKALRLTGVVPYPPFKSRAEYLEAALEMDLDEFIERAKVTPRSLIQKPSSPLTKVDREMVSGISKIIRRNPFRAFSTPAFGLPTLIQTAFGVPREALSTILGPSGVAGEPAPAGASGGAGSPSPSSQATREPGKWYRVKETGELIRACDCNSMTCIYHNVSNGDIRTHRPTEVEPAYPKSGEWWEKRRCGINHCRPGVSFIHGMCEWAGHNNGDRLLEELRAVHCGCLVPVNFGKGEEKSGVGGANDHFHTTLDNLMTKFSRGLEEVVALKKITTDLPFQTQATREPGKWYRVKETGELARACNCSAGCGCFMTFTEPLVYRLSNSVERAYPRKGEWWQRQPCPKIHRQFPSLVWLSGPIKWNYSTNTAHKSDGPEIEAALCGCLTPVNFGKGEKKSGVA